MSINHLLTGAFYTFLPSEVDDTRVHAIETIEYKANTAFFLVLMMCSFLNFFPNVFDDDMNDSSLH